MLLKGDEGVQNLEGGVAGHGDFRPGGQDARYPTLSGEWRSPGPRGVGGLPSGISPLVGVSRYP